MIAVSSRRQLLKLLLAAGAVARSSSAPATTDLANKDDSAARRGFSFAVIGDVPYSALDVPQLHSVLAAIEPSCEFILHVGDFKASTASCDDRSLEQRIAMLDSADRPLVFVPGDNDWSDCIKKSAGAYRPFERLDFLRARIFHRRHSLGRRPLPLSIQTAADGLTEMPENLQWQHHGTWFVTLNRPGGVDLRKFTDEESARMSDLHRANEAWLRQAFADAKKAGVRTMVIAAHANPGFENDHGHWRLPKRRDAHARFRRLLAELTTTFEGQVLFIHGDTHWFQFNQPLRNMAGEEIPNFTRLESFGTPFSSSWVQVRVKPAPAPGFIISAHHVDPTRRP